MRDNSDYGYWFSAKLWYGEGLKPTEKIVLQALSIKGARKGYIMSNSSIAYMCDLNTDTVARAVKKLEELKYLKKEKVGNKVNIILSDELFRRVFEVPTREEVVDFCEKKGISIDVDAFLKYNNERGWIMPKNSTYTWRFLVRIWQKNAIRRNYQRNYMISLEEKQKAEEKQKQELNEEEKKWYK